jgi:hypothetical protein
LPGRIFTARNSGVIRSAPKGTRNPDG